MARLTRTPPTFALPAAVVHLPPVPAAATIVARAVVAAIEVARLGVVPAAAVAAATIAARGVTKIATGSPGSQVHCKGGGQTLASPFAVAGPHRRH